MMDVNAKVLNELKSMIYDNMNMNRSANGKVNFMSYFFVLYAYKIHYPLSFVNSGNIFKGEMTLNDFHTIEGSLLCDLHRTAIQNSDIQNYRFQDVALLFANLTKIDLLLYNIVYKDIIEYLIETMAMSAMRMEGEIVQPKEITDVVCHILKKHSARNIYNPFSGLASYAIGMYESNHFQSYYGQDLNERAIILSRLRLDAYGMDNRALVRHTDVFESWGNDNQTFDTVVATPPFGQRIHDISISIFPNRKYHARTMEEYTLWNCLDETNGCKTAVVIVPTSFLYRKETFSLRKTICERKALEMVIDLPKNVFYGTGFPTSILVLNLAEQQDFVTFIDAQRAVLGKNRDLRLDKDNVIHMIEGYDSDNRVITHISNLFRYDCLFSAYIYAGEEIQPAENENVFSLGDLITESRGESYTGLKPCNTLSIEDFSTDFFQVMEKEDVSVCRLTSGAIKKVHGPHIVMTNMDGKVALYLHKGDTDFYIKSNYHVAVKVNTELVTPEYMAYMMLTSDWAKKISSYNMGTNISVINFIRLSSIKVTILFINEQKLFIDKKLNEYRQEQIRVNQAELKRLGYRDVYSDVIHMLGTPFHKQGQVVELLKNIDPNDESYHKWVKSLMDISMYIQRVIDTVGKDFSNTFVNFDRVDLRSFIKEYHNAWKNYGAGVYQMQIEVAPDEMPMEVNADMDLLMILMDTLMDNAKRHAFLSRNNPNNVVNVSLQNVEYIGKSYFLLSVSNNGLPLNDGFTIQDYITRGRFTGQNGRTGLGGNHVYTIVKKHGGYLNIHNDKVWNFVVDILLPMADAINNNLNEYDYEAI